LLRASLDELVRQLRPPERIVVCAPGADDIGVVADDAKIEVALGPRGPTCQRSAPLDQVRDCDVVIFFDDDFLPTPCYLEVVERVFTACPDVAMMTGLVIADGIIGPGISLEEARSWVAMFGTITRDWRELEEVANGYGCNMAMRLATVEAAHCRFDESLPLYGWLEDVDFRLHLAQRGRIVKALAAHGVHLGIKEGRQTGKRLGYSQIANPIYLSRKGTLPWLRALRLMSRNIAANLLRLMTPEPYIDRAGRASGNIKAFRDLLSGSLTPERILEL
jgi:hypothetical protein